MLLFRKPMGLELFEMLNQISLLNTTYTSIYLLTAFIVFFPSGTGTSLSSCSLMYSQCTWGVWHMVQAWFTLSERMGDLEGISVSRLVCKQWPQFLSIAALRGPTSLSCSARRLLEEGRDVQMESLAPITLAERKREFFFSRSYTNGHHLGFAKVEATGLIDSHQKPWGGAVRTLLIPLLFRTGDFPPQ